MYRSGRYSKKIRERSIFGDSYRYMVFMSHSTNVMDANSLPGIVHSDNNDTLSRQAPSWMYTLKMVTATPSLQSIWEISSFQQLQQEDDGRNRTEYHPLTCYSV